MTPRTIVDRQISVARREFLTTSIAKFLDERNSAGRGRHPGIETRATRLRIRIMVVDCVRSQHIHGNHAIVQTSYCVIAEFPSADVFLRKSRHAVHSQDSRLCWQRAPGFI